jgi:hypothetical protein
MVESLLGEREYTAPPSLDDRPSGATATDQAAMRLASRVSVTFVQPERFTDVKDSLLASPKGTADLLAEIDRYLHAAGERYVPPGLALEIQVTNIDLAGEFEPWRGPQFDRYEKQLLRGWLRQEFASGAQASRPSP